MMTAHCPAPSTPISHARNFRVAALAAMVVAAPTAIEAQTRPFTAEDMLNVVQISGAVAVAPAGDRLAFVLPDLSDDWNVGERIQVGSVHLLELGNGAGTPVPVGGAGPRSSYPVFSPDGDRLAFYIEDPSGGSLAILELKTMTVARVGSSFPGKAEAAPQWAGNDRVVYARPALPAPPPEQPRIQVLQITDPLPGDAFFVRDPRAGLRVVDVRSGQERELVADASALGRFSTSPDGRFLMATMRGARQAQLWSLETDGDPTGVGSGADRPEWTTDGRLLVRRQGMLATISPHDPAGTATRLMDLNLAVTGLAESPDGLRFAGLLADRSLTDPEIEPPQPNMYTIARPFLDVVLISSKDGRVTSLSADIADQIGSPTWSRDGSALYFVATDNATYDETLYRYDVESGDRVVLARGRESFGTMTPIADGLLVSVESATTPGDLWRFGQLPGERSRVTLLNPQLNEVQFSEPELFHFENQDGVRLGALLYRATGPVPAEGEPVITYVYEKLTPGIHRFQPRHQVFATHGYAVLMPNVMIKVGEPGTSYVSSVVPAVEAVRDMGFSSGRVCMWGGSFGAYATSFVITQTNIFDCAVSRATPPELFRNWASGRDRDSRNIESGQARMGGSPFEFQDRYLAQSAFFHLDQVETPVLITHGMKDYTILFEEGAMMFYALRQLGKQTTFVAYRDGDHSLYRHSRSDALDVHQRMLDWFALYLRPGTPPIH